MSTCSNQKRLAAFLSIFAVLIPVADALRPSYDDELQGGHVGHHVRLGAHSSLGEQRGIGMETASAKSKGSGRSEVSDLPPVQFKDTEKMKRKYRKRDELRLSNPELFKHGVPDLEDIPDPVQFPRSQRFAYVRHGESTGNAIHRIDYCDGRLTETGEEQAFKAAQALHLDLYYEAYTEDSQLIEVVNTKSTAYFILHDVTLAFVSPLRRAMATAVIFMASLWGLEFQKAMGPDWNPSMELPKTVPEIPPMPRFVVKQELQEKYKTFSELVGSRCAEKDPESENPLNLDGETTLHYVKRMARKWCKTMFGESGEFIMDDAVTQLMESYASEGLATRGGDDGSTPYRTKIPDTMEKFFSNIHQAKIDIAAANEPSLIVAHSGVSRFMFYGANGLPDPKMSWQDMYFGHDEDAQSKKQKEYFDFISRPVVKLENGGVVDGTWAVDVVDTLAYGMYIKSDANPYGIDGAIEQSLPFFSFTNYIASDGPVPLAIESAPLMIGGFKNAKKENQYAMFDEPKWCIREVATLLPAGSNWKRWRVMKQRTKGAKMGASGKKKRMLNIASRLPLPDDPDKDRVQAVGLVSWLEGTDLEGGNDGKWGDPIKGAVPHNMRRLQLFNPNAEDPRQPLLLKLFGGDVTQDDEVSVSTGEWWLWPVVHAGYENLNAVEVKKEIMRYFLALAPKVLPT
eukprot:CAMPEP_0178395460 /NCGR_PEP_ID=MMETSP0689_2-20121128/13230_1 /TAXON_ID=160604 /ORGANISM="Amphidinium massartii, Strain CS-259" /LENGTH=682 /DNA_ID=CAMNT_0020016115 /DNA_START=53 /DNA_END=2101 /DNA_ORIENTATION=+